MAYLDLLRTVHCPIRADGRTLKNSFGVQIAICDDEATAIGLAELVNRAVPIAERENEAHEKTEKRLAEMLEGDR